MPASVPPGLRLELSRSRIREGQEDGFTQWMDVLHDRYDEALESIPAERAAFETTFRHREADGCTWIYHLSLMGEGTGLDEALPIGATHAEYSRSVKEPGWEELEPMFMLAPAHLAAAMEHWGRTGKAPATEAPESGTPAEPAGA
ncbi:hypothetical protein GCM10009715_04910 [Paeniglutamicibacter psychrophenolicus]|uniref:Uncharacterized protein n=1 Tax=Paeniglutamicibacter psychrophenolicus TaxID=257454 RepID=A0ABS4WDQ5_9MICC|nr:DUF6176 family protein [Paeniglutamicibacter psychrophenolicus]MBP2374290.1 hypothetical protein [Paeniglutamicibacter psychrophenolicus]